MKEKRTAFLESLRDAPVIAAVKNEEGLARALESECAAVFVLQGSILNIAKLVRQIEDNGKLAFVHADLINGLAVRDITVDFLHEATRASGVISTRPGLIQRANELGLLSIQRFFLLDSLAFDNVLHQGCRADAVDILPGTMPRVIRRLTSQLDQPLIASGLLVDKQDVMSALAAGASAVSTTCEELWFA